MKINLRLPIEKEKEVIRLHLEGYVQQKIQAISGVSQSSVCRILKSNKLTDGLSKIPGYDDAVVFYLQGRTRREIRISTHISLETCRYIERRYADEKKRRLDTERDNKARRNAEEKMSRRRDREEAKQNNKKRKAKTHPDRED